MSAIIFSRSIIGTSLFFLILSCKTKDTGLENSSNASSNARSTVSQSPSGQLNYVQIKGRRIAERLSLSKNQTGILLSLSSSRFNTTEKYNCDISSSESYIVLTCAEVGDPEYASKDKYYLSKDLKTILYSRSMDEYTWEIENETQLPSSDVATLLLGNSSGSKLKYRHSSGRRVSDYLTVSYTNNKFDLILESSRFNSKEEYFCDKSSSENYIILTCNSVDSPNEANRDKFYFSKDLKSVLFSAGSDSYSWEIDGAEQIDKSSLSAKLKDN